MLKTKDKEIEVIRKKFEAEKRRTKELEKEIVEYKDKIHRFNADIDEYKNTTRVLTEAQRKNIDIEKRQQEK